MWFAPCRPTNVPAEFVVRQLGKVSEPEMAGTGSKAMRFTRNVILFGTFGCDPICKNIAAQSALG